MKFYISTVLRFKEFSHQLRITSKKLYQISFKRYLLLTNMGVSAILYTTGDYIEQKIIEKKGNIDYKRLLGFSGAGLFYGVFGYNWYRIMHSLPSMRMRPHRQALLYQLVFCPLEYVLFFTYIGFVEGESGEVIRQEINDKVLYTYLTDWCVYYPFQVLNVTYVPIYYRAILDNTFNFFWTVFLSFVKHHSLNEIAEDVFQFNSLKSLEPDIDL